MCYLLINIENQPPKNKCSIRILVPISMSTSPPITSAFVFNFSPNILPSFTPVKQQTKVISPIIEIAGTMFTLRKAKVTPIASASMLVATEILLLLSYLFL